MPRWRSINNEKFFSASMNNLSKLPENGNLLGTRTSEVFFYISKIFFRSTFRFFQDLFFIVSKLLFFINKGYFQIFRFMNRFCQVICWIRGSQMHFHSVFGKIHRHGRSDGGFSNSSFAHGKENPGAVFSDLFQQQLKIHGRMSFMFFVHIPS